MQLINTTNTLLEISIQSLQLAEVITSNGCLDTINEHIYTKKQHEKNVLANKIKLNTSILDLMPPRIALLWKARYSEAEFNRQKKEELKELSSVSLTDLITSGINCPPVLRIMETFITHNNSYVDQAMIERFALIIKPDIVKRFLARKYLENGISILHQYQNPSNFA